VRSLHIIPLDDTMDHVKSGDCACFPLLMEHGYLVHNAKDCREKLERQGVKTGKKWITLDDGDELQPA
jgi:hypothetical protein